MGYRNRCPRVNALIPGTLPEEARRRPSQRRGAPIQAVSLFLSIIQPSINTPVGLSRRVVTALGFLLLTLSGESRAQASSMATPADIVLRPGDALRITVWRKPELTGQFAIALDGSIAHPLYRVVRVTGTSLPALEARLRTFLEQYEEAPQFVIEPLLRVAIGGEVERPNLYTLGPETSISQAVALAGGPTERGYPDRVRLTRRGTTRTIDLTNTAAGSSQLAIESGDEIVVERRRAIFREVITPIVTIIGAAAAVTTAIVRVRD